MSLRAYHLPEAEYPEDVRLERLVETVRDFGVWLGVPRENIFAVHMEYDQLAGE